MPPSALFDWTTACRPRFAALLDAHTSSDNSRIGAAFDSILQAPAVFLVRKGGRWGSLQAVNRLKSWIQARLAGREPPALAPHHEAAPPRHDPDRDWSRRLERARELALRGQFRRAGQALLRPDFVTPTPSQCQKLRNKHTNTSSTIPALPATAPRIAIDTKALHLILKQAANGQTGGPSSDCRTPPIALGR